MSSFTKILSCIGLPTTVVDSSAAEGNTVLKCIVRDSALSNLLGTSAVQQVEVNQWLTLSQSALGVEQLQAVNAILLTKTFLVGFTVTLADFAVFAAISNHKMNIAEFSNLSRWFRHIQSLSQCIDDVAAVKLAAVNAAATVAVPVLDSDAASLPTPPPPPATAAAADATPASQQEGKEKKGKEGKDKKSADAGATTAPPPSSSSSTAPPAAAAATSADNLDPTKLDIRCGLVIKCWNHPESEKLLCEEIDLGSAEQGGGGVRQIASGLRAYYTAEQLQGRKVLVLANLKERPMAGFKSQVSFNGG